MKILTVSELTDEEKRFLALAIQDLALRQGPEVFGIAVSCAGKLGLEEYLTEYLQSWIDYGKGKKVTPSPEADSK